MQPVRVLSRLFICVLFLFAVCAVAPVPAQTSRDFAVLLHAGISTTPEPAITLHWNADPYATYYSIERKSVAETGWTFIGETGPDASSFTDTSVEPGQGYEYAVIKRCRQPIKDDSVFTYWGSGYIYAGIDILPSEKTRRVLLLVDNTMASPLASELEQLEQDMVREGWQVTRRDVPRTETFSSSAVQAIKSIITSEYSAAPNLTSVFIFGRVAVPYSGRMAPDGHPDHRGAWPADSYYADIDGTWTDQTINDDTTALGREQNRNIIGDGKFDQSSIPSLLELQVGRVDFYNMSDLTLSETELLRRYLNKDHRYRTGQVTVKQGGVIDDNFWASTHAEAFASSGWRNMALFSSEETVKNGNLVPTSDTNTYLWAYGCGPGSYSSAQEVCFTAQFNLAPLNAVFTMLFGSYFGDWDSPSNLLRGALGADPSVLTCVWAARPHWYFHHMLMGEPIGLSALASQNNGTVYIPNYNYHVPGYPNGVIYSTGNRQIHAALMGDPTLRVYNGDPVERPLSLTAEQPAGSGVHLQWTAPSGQVDGYQIFRSTSPGGPFTRVADSIVTQTHFVDEIAFEGNLTYMVRSIARRQSRGGTYLDAGPGATYTLAVTGVGEQAAGRSPISCFPNPADQSAVVSFQLEDRAFVDIDIFDVTGARIVTLLSAERMAGRQTVAWNLAGTDGRRVAPGVYLVRCRAGSVVTTAHIVVQP